MADITKIIDLKVVGTEKLHALEQEISKTEKKLKNMTSAGKKNVGMQKIHQKNIDNTKVKLKLLRTERNNEQKAIITSTQAAKQLDGSYNGLVARNKELITKMKSVSGGMNSNTAEMKAMKKEYVDNNNKLKEFDSSLGNNQRNVGNYGSALGNVKERLTNVGMAVGAAVVAFQAISNAVAFATKDFMEFETGMASIMSLMSGDDIQQFGQELQTGAIDVMKEFGLQTADMNKAMFDAVSAGVPAAETVEFMRNTAMLATGGVTDLSTAVDGVTTVMNSFGIATSDTDQITAAFFSAQKFGKTTVEELSSSIGNVAPIAVQAGLGYKELLSAMAVLTKQGISTDESATALRATISALTKPSEQAKKQFDALGISYGASALQSEGLMTILKQISDAGNENADVLATLIPNVKALTGVGALGTEQLAEYDEILRTVNTDYGENSSLAQANSLQQETLQKKMDRLNAEFREQKILLGEQLKPIFSEVLRLLGFLIENLGTIATVVKRGTIAFVAYKTAVFALNGGLKAASIGMKAMTIATRALNVAMRANPVGLLVGGLALLVPLLFKGKEGTEEMNEAQSEQEARMKRITDIQDKYQQNQIKEIASAKDAFQAITNENLTREERGKLIDQVNEKYGTTLQNLDDEAAMANQLSGAYDLVVKSIKNKIKQQQASEERIAFIEDEIALEKELQEQMGNNLDIQTNLNNIQAQIGIQTRLLNSEYEKLTGNFDMNTRRGRRAAERALKNSESYQTLKTKVDGLNSTYNKYNDALVVSQKGQKKATDEIDRNKVVVVNNTKETKKNTEATTENTQVKEDTRTAYQKMQDAVSKASDVVRDLIIQEKQGKDVSDKLKKAKQDLKTKS